MTKQISLKEFRRDPATAARSFLAGIPLQIDAAEAARVWMRLDGVALSRPAMKAVRQSTRILRAGAGTVELDHDMLAKLGKSVETGQDDAGSVQKMTGEPISTGALIIIGVALAVGFGIGWMTGDVGEEEDSRDTNVTATSENGSVTVTVGDGKEE